MNKLGDFELNTIVTGDARELAKGIPDESVDLIFTDPVYQNIDDYRWLAETAARVLKPDRACLAFCDNPTLADTIQAMMTGLKYRRLFVQYMPTIRACQMPVYRLWTPLIWFDKGSFGLSLARRIQDLRKDGRFHSLAWDENHSWTKSPDFIAYYLNAFCSLDDIVWDPFTGGGTVPAVCKMLGRNYLAFEIDPDTAELARERVRNTQPPLFVPRPEQAGMELKNG